MAHYGRMVGSEGTFSFCAIVTVVFLYKSVKSFADADKEYYEKSLRDKRNTFDMSKKGNTPPPFNHDEQVNTVNYETQYVIKKKKEINNLCNGVSIGKIKIEIIKNK